MPPVSGERQPAVSLLRVLVVDDDANVRHILCAHLDRRGHKGVGVATMQEALLVLTASHFDVLVTDVLLPDGDGIDLLNRPYAPWW